MTSTYLRPFRPFATNRVPVDLNQEATARAHDPWGAKGLVFAFFTLPGLSAVIRLVHGLAAGRVRAGWSRGSERETPGS